MKGSILLNWLYYIFLIVILSFHTKSQSQHLLLKSQNVMNLFLICLDIESKYTVSFFCVSESVWEQACGLYDLCKAKAINRKSKRHYIDKTGLMGEKVLVHKININVCCIDFTIPVYILKITRDVTENTHTELENKVSEVSLCVQLINIWHLFYNCWSCVIVYK